MLRHGMIMGLMHLSCQRKPSIVIHRTIPRCQARSLAVVEIAVTINEGRSS